MKSLLLLALVLGQSLGEIARREAERRRNIDAQGAPEKTILQQDVPRLGSGGALSTSSLPPSPKGPPVRSSASRRTRDSPERFRGAIQKLDREIRSAEDRLASLRARVEAERWTPPRTARSRRGTRVAQSEKRPRLDVQIKDWEMKLKRLRQDRFETYDAGLKAGFLPGELDGKGIWP